jgi:3-methyladenine DNA glycosylase Mpg
MPLSPLPASFYSQPVIETSRALLGTRLVRHIAGKRIAAGYIIETEAYAGESDLVSAASASICRRGRYVPLPV